MGKIKADTYIFCHFRLRWVILTLAIGIMLSLLNGQQSDSDHNPLHYDVDVVAQVIPVYAVDEDGNPVFDLKSEDIELFINGKAQPILYFMNFQVEAEAEATSGEEKTSVTGQQPPEEKAETVQPVEVDEYEKAKADKTVTGETPERIVFIIIDGISNSANGVRNSKRLAAGIIKSGSRGDAFIIYISSIKKGLEYIIGPEKDKEKLLQVLEKLYANPQWIITVPKRHFTFSEAPDPGEVAMWQQLGWMFGMEKLDNEDLYNMSLNRFSRSLGELKNALKTIRLPKHIFLVSGGVQEMASVSSTPGEESGSAAKTDDSMIMGYYGMMAQATYHINQGGSMLYLVNPIPETYKNHKAVNIMSKISNAKCISGANIDEMLTKVKKSTSAYYEIAFSITPEMAENFSVEVKCKRKKIALNTLKFGEKSRPYSNMPEMLKKLFAMNVVMGGSWARIIAKITVAESEKIDEVFDKEKNATVKKISVIIPEELQEKMVDVYILNIEPNSLKADIQLSKRLAGKTEVIDVEVQKNRKQFFVMIEPRSTRCIVNRVL